MEQRHKTKIRKFPALDRSDVLIALTDMLPLRFLLQGTRVGGKMPSQEEQNQGEAWLPEPTVQGTGHLQDYHGT